MNVKTFQGASIAEAVAKVKQELGSNAVILHTRSFKRGGIMGVGARTIVEITASANVNTQPRKRTADPVLAVREPELLHDRAAFVDDAELVRSTRPIDPDEHPLTSLIDDTCLGAEGPSRVLIRWPSTRLTPNAGRGPSARSERRHSSWLSESKRLRPSPSGRQEHHRTLTSGSDGMVEA